MVAVQPQDVNGDGGVGCDIGVGYGAQPTSSSTIKKGVNLCDIEHSPHLFINSKYMIQPVERMMHKE